MVFSPASSAAPFFQLLPPSVIIKNTFLDVDDEEWRKDNRIVKTCPDYMWSSVSPGLDSELPPRHSSAPQLRGNGNPAIRDMDTASTADEVPEEPSASADYSDLNSEHEQCASDTREDVAEDAARRDPRRPRGGRRHRNGRAKACDREGALEIAAPAAEPHAQAVEPHAQRGNAAAWSMAVREGASRRRLPNHAPAPEAVEAPAALRGCDAQKEGNGSQHRGRTSYSRGRFWCHLYINPEMLQPGFDLNKKIIGRGGSCTKRIFETTGAKIRLRGLGSGFLERPSHGRNSEQQEAPVPLMLTIVGDRGDSKNFRRAVAMAVDLLRDISERFAAFCRKASRSTPQVDRAFWVGNMVAEGLQCCATCLHDVHVESRLEN